MQIPLLSQMAAKSNQKLLYENELKDSHQSIYTLVEIPNFCSKNTEKTFSTKRDLMTEKIDENVH